MVACGVPRDRRDRTTCCLATAGGVIPTAKATRSEKRYRRRLCAHAEGGHRQGLARQAMRRGVPRGPDRTQSRRRPAPRLRGPATVRQCAAHLQHRPGRTRNRDGRSPGGWHSEIERRYRSAAFAKCDSLVINGVAETPPSLERISALVEEGAFEETLAALELVVEHLERGRLTLDESIAWYEAGLGLMRRCSRLLEQAELRISALDAEDPAHSRDDHGLVSESAWDSDAS